MSPAAPSLTSMAEVVITHPHALLLHTTGRGVVGTAQAVLAGEWDAVIDLCADPAAGAKIPDPTTARRALQEAAAASGLAFPEPDRTPLGPGDPAGLREQVRGEDTVVITGPLGASTAALDLFMRLLCGQWAELDWHCALASATDRAPGWDPLALNSLRCLVSRTRAPVARGEYRPLTEDEFPDHPSASVSIASAVLPARVAYHAYKHLGGGTVGAPTFSLPGGPVEVRLDGQIVNRIRSY
ncbi:hypothetical protein [Nocardioides sp. Leaf285]|uniref:hypothetical protein n=1 Tax=Nocardioides sp. Leaf285 TaxID=1736322 RepID=UPI000723C681|nr:hypothetical protein [Nocardioides sp. Leaf285]KQP63122.1 hypothetical protein ASF47_19120 [Nocardioides sp. Leaf285]